MLEHLLERLEGVSGLDEIYVVTNSKFAGLFGDWAEGIELRTCGSSTTARATRETRLGAIGDLDLTIRTAEIDDDALVLAGDNLFMRAASAVRRSSPAPRPRRRSVSTTSAISRRSGSTTRSSWTSRIGSPSSRRSLERPTSTLTGIALYFYPRSDLKSSAIYSGGEKQPRPAGTTGAVALPANAGVRLACSGPLVRTSARRRPSPRPTALSRPATDTDSSPRRHPRVTRSRLPSPEEVSVV